MATKKVKILSSIAGESYSYDPNQIVEIDAVVANAWIESGLCVDAPESDVAANEIAALQQRLESAEAERDGLSKAKTDLEGKLATAVAEKKGALAETAIHKKAASDATAQVADMKKQIKAYIVGGEGRLSDLTKERGALQSSNDELAVKVEELTAELAKLSAATTDEPRANPEGSAP
jgi:chromosome segregation ATPase